MILSAAPGLSAETRQTWNPEKAARWLDHRAETWLAAIAVGRAPGYYGKEPQVSPAVEKQVELLRGWLKKSRNPDNLFGEAWLPQASIHLDGLLTDEEKTVVVAKLKAAQNQDGGDKGSWTLHNLNKWKYSGAAPPEKPRNLNPEAFKPEGYSTGLMTCSLLDAGVPATDPVITSAAQWLTAHQRGDGSWRAYSLNENRDVRPRIPPSGGCPTKPPPGLPWL
ncbi:MAG: hypothetical protein V4726_00780 [Verrucomicrobiota bacterium]